MIPLTATIFVTDKCNLACSYCYEPNKEYSDITKEYIFQFIQLLYDTPEYSAREKITLDFIGGEPLLVPHLIEYSIDTFFAEGRKRKHHWVKYGNFIIFATTNGTLFGEEPVKKLVEKYPCLQFGISLDGDKESHDKNRKYLSGQGSYDKIMENFEWWKNRYKQLLVKGTLSHNNLGNVANMLYHQVELGLHQPWANPVYEEVWTQKDAVVYKQQVEQFLNKIIEQDLELVTSIQGICRKRNNSSREENYCGTGKHMVTLGLDGKLYPCHRFATNSHKYSIGNVNAGLDKNALVYLLKEMKKIECSDCKQNGSCPVCYASFYDIHGGNFAPVTNVCAMVKVEMEMMQYFVQKVLEKSYSVVEWR